MADQAPAVEEEEAAEEQATSGKKKKKTSKKKAAAKEKPAKDAGGAEEEDELETAVKECLSIKGKWMYCAVAIAGTKVVFTLDPKKAVTTDGRLALKKKLTGKIVIFEGACKTGGILDFRLVAPKNKKPPSQLKKYLKGWVNSVTHKNYKVNVGETMEKMPDKLKELDKKK